MTAPFPYILCLFLQDKFECYTEVVLHSSAAKYRKFLRTKLRMIFRMVGEYGPRNGL